VLVFPGQVKDRLPILPRNGKHIVRARAKGGEVPLGKTSEKECPLLAAGQIGDVSFEYPDRPGQQIGNERGKNRLVTY
jgi:hypothetical protein